MCNFTGSYKKNECTSFSFKSLFFNKFIYAYIWIYCFSPLLCEKFNPFNFVHPSAAAQIKII